MLLLVFVQGEDIQYFGEVNGRKSSLRVIAKYLAARRTYHMKEHRRNFFTIYDSGGWLGDWLPKNVGYFYILDTSDSEFVICPELEFGKYGVLANVEEN